MFIFDDDEDEHTSTAGSSAPSAEWANRKGYYQVVTQLLGSEADGGDKLKPRLRAEVVINSNLCYAQRW